MAIKKIDDTTIEETRTTTQTERYTFPIARYRLSVLIAQKDQAQAVVDDLKKQIDELLENIVVVAVALIVGGVIFIWLDDFFKSRQSRVTSVEDDINLPKALNIGMFQVLAMVPGVSRSAATIFGGLSQGLSPATAAEFSFFLAVPTMFAATCKSLYDFLKKEGGSFSDQDLMLLGVGNLVAFLVAFAAIRYFIRFLTRHGFKWFGWYRIVVGLIILILWKTGFFEGVSVGNF